MKYVVLIGCLFLAACSDTVVQKSYSTGKCVDVIVKGKSVGCEGFDLKNEKYDMEWVQ